MRSWCILNKTNVQRMCISPSNNSLSKGNSMLQFAAPGCFLSQFQKFQTGLQEIGYWGRLVFSPKCNHSKTWLVGFLLVFSTIQMQTLLAGSFVDLPQISSFSFGNMFPFHYSPCLSFVFFLMFAHKDNVTPFLSILSLLTLMQICFNFFFSSLWYYCIPNATIIKAMGTSRFYVSL